MLAYLYGVITAGAVNQKFAVDVYGNMVYLQQRLHLPVPQRWVSVQ